MGGCNIMHVWLQDSVLTLADTDNEIMKYADQIIKKNALYYVSNITFNWETGSVTPSTGQH